ncbi:hypothetical protein [Lysobacter gummosus]
MRSSSKGEGRSYGRCRERITACSRSAVPAEPDRYDGLTIASGR